MNINTIEEIAEQIAFIKEIRDKEKLTDEELNKLNIFINTYFSLKREQKEESFDNIKEAQLQKYNDLLTDITNHADETENRNKPVYYITNNRFIGYATALERMAKDEAYTRKLTKNEQGFSKVLLIVIITIICGIILGSLLFFIK